MGEKRQCRERREVRLTLSILSCPDRKSTRLNSSHMSISYAVFCLKKKRQTRYIPFLSADRLCPFCYTPRPGPPFLPDLLSDPLSAFFGLAPLPLAHLCRLAFPPAP